MEGRGNGASDHHRHGKSCMCSSHCGEAHHPNGSRRCGAPPLSRFSNLGPHPLWRDNPVSSCRFLHPNSHFSLAIFTRRGDLMRTNTNSRKKSTISSNLHIQVKDLHQASELLLLNYSDMVWIQHVQTKGDLCRQQWCRAASRVGPSGRPAARRNLAHWRACCNTGLHFHPHAEAETPTWPSLPMRSPCMSLHCLFRLLNKSISLALNRIKSGSSIHNTTFKSGLARVRYYNSVKQTVWPMQIKPWKVDNERNWS